MKLALIFWAVTGSSMSVFAGLVMLFQVQVEMVVAGPGVISPGVISPGASLLGEGGRGRQKKESCNQFPDFCIPKPREPADLSTGQLLNSCFSSNLALLGGMGRVQILNNHPYLIHSHGNTTSLLRHTGLQDQTNPYIDVIDQLDTIYHLLTIQPLPFLLPPMVHGIKRFPQDHAPKCIAATIS
ncbi:hypothetical protein CK203_042415 [Vitis vinifera]|uniref:Uncharacterized protein n=1 Tax=Vitis vinifera TaxID=29760 RepID=A0A438H5C1_VITVI|nr:hypothetical protein CK203_042415 [Vitis vinifera]